MVLTAYFVLSPATNSSCHRHRRIKVLSDPVGPTRLRQLDTSNGCQDHTASPSAATSFVSAPFDRSQVSSTRPAITYVPDAAASTASRPASVTIAIRPLCPEILAECANGRLIGNRPLLELSPLRPKGDRACLRARDSSGVFLNPNSCKGFEPAPSKEGSG